MKHVVFEVDGKKSYIENKRYLSQKPKANYPFTSPLIVPLMSSSKVSLTIDETTNTAFGDWTVQFMTDQLAKSSMHNITGNLQTINVFFNDLKLEFDPNTGQIQTFSGSWWIHGEPCLGGRGSLILSQYGSASLLDGNSPSFNISNGLGCGGGVVIQMYTGHDISTFHTRIEATVVAEDVDGDGKFELACPGLFWKSLRIEYDPPTIRVLPPEYEGAMQPFLGVDVLQAIRLTELLKITENLLHSQDENVRIDRIELVGAQHLSAVLFDAQGNVYGGRVSNERTKVLKIPAVDVNNLLVGVLPSRGVAVIHPQSTANLNRQD